jgi:hypothetical protein
LAQPSASNAASTLLVAIKTNVMERPPIGEGSGAKRSQDRPPVLCKKRKPAVLRENSGLGYISMTVIRSREISSGLLSAV